MYNSTQKLNGNNFLVLQKEGGVTCMLTVTVGMVKLP